MGDEKHWRKTQMCFTICFGGEMLEFPLTCKWSEEEKKALEFHGVDFLEQTAELVVDEFLMGVNDYKRELVALVKGHLEKQND